MQEIGKNVYIETSYAGVTLGAIKWSPSLLLIDAPFRQEDILAWKNQLADLYEKPDRLLISLDSHYDRILGAQGMECCIINQEDVVQTYRERPVTFKTQFADTGADWELHNGLSNIRWTAPEITFTDQLTFYWDEFKPILIQHRPGPAIGASWVILEEQKVIFLGDAVTPGVPPFLASADLPAWVSNLEDLLSPEFKGYHFISGRCGLIDNKQIKKQLSYLSKIHDKMEEMFARNASPDEVEKYALSLCSDFSPSVERQSQFDQRLRYGFSHYYARHYNFKGL